MGELVLPLVESPRWKFAVLKCCPDVLELPVHFVLCRRNCFGPISKGVVDTLLGCDVMVAVPVQVLVCLGRFPVN